MNQSKEENGIIPIAETDIITISAIEDLISVAQKRLGTVPQLVELSLKVTNYRDWTLQDGSPYLGHSGAEKVARLFGVKISNVAVKKEFTDDTEGKFYIYVITGKCSLPGDMDSIEAIGTCSQRDSFFSKSGGKRKDSNQIDETNIMKAAYSNFIVNGITHLLGLRNLTIEQLSEANIDLSKVLKVGFAKGTQKISKTLEEDSKKLRQRIEDMAIQMSGGDEKAMKKILKDNSKFAVKDPETGEPVDKFIDDIKYLTSAKWIKSTHGRMKKSFQEAYPDEALPFEEENGNSKT